MSGLEPSASTYFALLPVLRTLISDSNDAITLQDLDGRILAWNHGAERMYGYTEAEALAMNVAAMTLAADTSALDYLRVIRAGGDVPPREVRRRAKDGRLLDVWLTTTRVIVDGVLLVATTERDMTERRRYEETLRFELDAMAKLHRISSMYLAERSEESILDEILDAAIEISEAAFGNIQIRDPTSGDLNIVRHRGFSASWVEYWNSVSEGRGSCGTALERRERVIVEDITQSAIFVGTDALAVQLAAGIRAVQSTPLIGRSGIPIGMLSTHYGEARRPPERALAMLDLLANQAAEVIERVRSDAALRRSEATAAGILAASAEALISIGADSKIRRWNAAAETMFGYAQHEAIGRSLDLVIPERYHAEHDRSVAAFAAESVAARHMDHRSAVGRRANGEEFPISATISKIAIEGDMLMTVAVRDVTDVRREQGEQQLLAELGGVLASTDYETALHDITTVAVARLAELAALFMEHDAELHRAAVASRDPALLRWAPYIMETPSKPVPGHPLWTAFSTQRPIVTQLDETLYPAIAQSPEQLAALQATRPRSTLCVPFVVGNTCRGVLGLASTSRQFDARDIKLAEKIAGRCALYIESARLHRVKQQAIWARDQMLGVVAHDLRSPLSTLGLQAELLREQSESRGPAEVIARVVRQMTRIIEDLLDISRMDSGQLAIARGRVPAAVLLADAQESLSSQVASRGLSFQRQAPDTLPVVSADAPRIQQVFDNLVGNALKFTERGTIAIGARDHVNEVEFWVADTGRGIEPEHLAHVFDRFWQARPGRRMGAGLGLAIVKGIVEAHGGRMRIESALGVGTTVFFSLPVADESSVRVATAPERLSSITEG